MSVGPHPSRARLTSWDVLPLLLMLALSMGTYFAWRYGTNWAEIDSSRTARAIHGVLTAGNITPGEGLYVYPNGYGCQAVSTFIILLTGLPISTLQQLVYPLTIVILIFPAYALYRELTGTVTGAALATLILFLQPEFLFVILRSTHEKFTRLLMMLALLLLLRSFKLRGRPMLFTMHVLLFYLATYGVIVSNNLLAASFIAAIMVAMVGGWLAGRRTGAARLASEVIIQRLAYVSGASLMLAFLFTFYVYPPALHDIRVMKSLFDQVAAMLLNVEARNPYTQVDLGWVSLPVYFSVSLANWLMLGVSLLVWVRQTVRWVIRKQQPNLTAWGWWLLYTSFAVQEVISVVVDLSGALSGNLQHRLFPSVGLVAGGLIAIEFFGPRAHRPAWMSSRRAWQIAVPVVAALVVLSMLKATNEPSLSNKWTFYTDAELHAFEWADSHLSKSIIWTGLDERLVVAYTTSRGGVAPVNGVDFASLEPRAAYALISDITRLRAARLAQTLPDVSQGAMLYDNGSTGVYRLTPLP
jgi:hypothetical protein